MACRVVLIRFLQQGMGAKVGDRNDTRIVKGVDGTKASPVPGAKMLSHSGSFLALIGDTDQATPELFSQASWQDVLNNPL